MPRAIFLDFEIEVNRRREVVSFQVVLKPWLKALMLFKVRIALCFFVRLFFLELLILLNFHFLFKSFLFPWRS